MRFNPIESIRELALHAQNSVENACISAKVAMGPAKSYDEIGSADNSKGCESDHNGAKASINDTDTQSYFVKNLAKSYRKNTSALFKALLINDIEKQRVKGDKKK